MHARDIMSAGVLSIKPTTQVSEIAKLLNDHRISAVPVLDEHQRLLGIVSEGDLLRRQELGTERRRSWWLTMLSDMEQRASDYAKSHAKLAKDIMTTNVITVKEDTSAQAVADLLERHHIKRVPVLRDDKVIGIVSRANLIQGLAIRRPESLVNNSNVDDLTIRNSLISTLKKELDLSLTTVNIIVEDGVVHLWGMVDGAEERKAVRVAAENTEGVTKVDSRLILSSAIPYGI